MIKMRDSYELKSKDIMEKLRKGHIQCVYLKTTIVEQSRKINEHNENRVDEFINI